VSTEKELSIRLGVESAVWTASRSGTRDRSPFSAETRATGSQEAAEAPREVITQEVLRYSRRRAFNSCWRDRGIVGGGERRHTRWVEGWMAAPLFSREAIRATLPFWNGFEGSEFQPETERHSCTTRTV
jgi:hypothetical protein